MTPFRQSQSDAPSTQTFGWVAIALVLLGVIVLLVWNQGAQRRAIGRLPEAERRALYLQTRGSLEQLCRNPSDALRDYCRDQAEFLSNFPECDASCRALIAEQQTR